MIFNTKEVLMKDGKKILIKTMYFTPEVWNLLNNLYALRIVSGEKTPKGKIIGEGLSLLADVEQRKESQGE